MTNLRHGAFDAGGRDPECPRVVVAAPELPIRRGVRLALEGDGFVVSAEADTAEGAVAAALDDSPDVCLIDVGVTGGGIAAAAAIRLRLPDTPVVMLSDSDEDLFAALHAGASGYLPKATNPARLGPALRDVLKGRAALPRTLTARLIEEFRARGKTSLTRRGENDLTIREWEVLDCLRESLSTHGIAKRLFISETTVRRHAAAIMRKLKVPSRAAAVELVARRSGNLNGE